MATMVVAEKGTAVAAASAQEAAVAAQGAAVALSMREIMCAMGLRRRI